MRCLRGSGYAQTLRKVHQPSIKRAIYPYLAISYLYTQTSSRIALPRVYTHARTYRGIKGNITLWQKRGGRSAVPLAVGTAVLPPSLFHCTYYSPATSTISCASISTCIFTNSKTHCLWLQYIPWTGNMTDC